jgi:hypothetical protein
MNIHIVETLNKFVRLPDNQWESGWWDIDEDRAGKLIGGNVFFHKKQMEPSFFGGTITGYRIEQEAQHEGMIVFTLQYNAACRDIRTDKGGWSKKMKIISHE